MRPDKQPIPIPLARKLQFMQTKIVPLLVLGMTAITAAMLWKEAISPAMLVGEVSTQKSNINSPMAAEVIRINAQRLTQVKAGEVIAEVRPIDARQSLDLLQNELNLLRIEVGNREARRRETMDFERLQLDWMIEKINLSKATSAAKSAAATLEITEAVTTPPAATGRYQQAAQLAKEAADDEVIERQTLVATLGKRIEELRHSMDPKTQDSFETWKTKITLIEERFQKIATSQEAIQLRAPIDGMITEVLRNEGENVLAGEPLLLLTAAEPKSITGYLRQPFPLEPAIGQKVEVRTHAKKHLIGNATITRVGVHFEPILNPALHPTPTPEVGLPIEVSLPPNIKLRPGELVSLMISPSSANEPAL
jgi:multidrug resistance efflux pump